jgi:hypothetical protein
LDASSVATVSVLSITGTSSVSVSLQAIANGFSAQGGPLTVTINAGVGFTVGGGFNQQQSYYSYIVFI